MPSSVQAARFFSAVDTFCDYTPVSPVTNGVDLVVKVILYAKERNGVKSKNIYAVHIRDKSTARCVILMAPVGFVIFIVVDLVKLHQKTQTEEKVRDQVIEDFTREISALKALNEVFIDTNEEYVIGEGEWGALKIMFNSHKTTFNAIKKYNLDKNIEIFGLQAQYLQLKEDLMQGRAAFYGKIFRGFTDEERPIEMRIVYGRYFSPEEKDSKLEDWNQCLDEQQQYTLLAEKCHLLQCEEDKVEARVIMAYLKEEGDKKGRDIK